jgi:hypothetical protein
MANIHGRALENAGPQLIDFEAPAAGIDML